MLADFSFTPPEQIFEEPEEIRLAWPSMAGGGGDAQWQA